MFDDETINGKVNEWHKQEASMQAHLWLRDIGNSTTKVAILVATMVAEAAVVAMQGFVGLA